MKPLTADLRPFSAGFLLVLSLLLRPGLGFGQPIENAEALRNRAQTAQAQGDFNQALTLHNQAVALDPNDVVSRFYRGVFLYSMLHAVRSESVKMQIDQGTRQEIDWMLRNAPDHDLTAVALDMLNSMDGRTWFEEGPVQCDAEGQTALDEAEVLFASKNYIGAIPRFEVAIQKCSTPAVAWIHLGNTHYSLEDFEAAIKALKEGLKLDPWNRSGHRFLSGSYSRLNRVQDAYDEAILTILSDPLYEAGWTTLKRITLQQDGIFRRVRPDMPKIVKKPEGGYELGIQSSKNPTDADAWMSYGLAKINLLLASEGSDVVPTPLKDETEEMKKLQQQMKTVSTQGPLEQEVFLIRLALQVYRQAHQDGRPDDSSFWSLMDRAESLGLLKEMIYLSLLNEKLVPSFKEYRNQHPQELKQCFTRLIAQF